MVYKWVPPTELISRLEFTYGVQSPEYIQLLPMWITDGLRALKVKLPLEPIVVERTVKNGMITLPNDLSILSFVAKDGVPLVRQDKTKIKTLSPKDYNQLVESTVIGNVSDGDFNIHRRSVVANASVITPSSTGVYLLHANGIVEVDNSCEDGSTIEIYYLRIPTMTDEVTGIRVPMIPDTQPVLENLSWIVLRNLMYRGYKHRIFNINSNNPHTNPATMYNSTMASARNSIMVWDGEKYNLITKTMNAIISNIDHYNRNIIR